MSKIAYLEMLNRFVIIVFLIAVVGMPAGATNSAGVVPALAERSDNGPCGVWLNLGNGNLLLERTDLGLGNPGIALGVTRYYNPLDWDVERNQAYYTEDPAVFDRAFIPSPFGAHWTSGFNAAIFPAREMYSAGQYVILRDGSGAYYTFQAA